jgi:fructosamine-3-kinase
VDTDTIEWQGLLRQLLIQTFGTSVVIEEIETANQLTDYRVLLVQLRHPNLKVVVKFAGPEAPYPCPFDRTAMLHGLVASRTTIPMPEILAVDTSYQSWPWRYLIKVHIPGQEWATAQHLMGAEDLSGAYRQIGSAVAQLHAIHFPAFGELSLDGNISAGKSCFAALTERARNFIKKPHLQDLFLSVLDQHQGLFLDIHPACLCHEDLHRYNILFHFQQGKWRLATILDFDKGWAGHNEIDLARLDLWKGMVTPDFWEAYTALGSIDPLYQQRRPIYQFGWCLEYAEPTEEHLSDTRRLCAELGLPRLMNFD